MDKVIPGRSHFLGGISSWLSLFFILAHEFSHVFYRVTAGVSERGLGFLLFDSLFDSLDFG